jgi:hypothetical protein
VRRLGPTTGLFAAIVFWGMGCAGEDPAARQCEIAGVGSGTCCDLIGADGAQLPGACINGFCTNGATEQLNGTCGSAPVRDMGRVIGGSGGVGGQGGAGGAGGIGGAGGVGGVGGEGGLGGDGVGGDGGMGGEGGGGNPCDGTVCDPGARCNPASGLCEAPPAGSCAQPAECPDGECLADLPGGFCLVQCADDAGCGPAGRCLPNNDNEICYDRCDDGSNCREGWICNDVTDQNGMVDGQVCVPDCNEAGCGRGQSCNAETGLCEQVPTPCPYACQGGEECRDARCVRLNGTCVTDYHCELGTEQCYEGQCVPAEVSQCVGAAACAASQSCIPVSQNPADPGICLFNCGADVDCPINEACYEGINACYFLRCGPGAANNDNGQIRGACNAGIQGQWPGTCRPLAIQPGEAESGFCFEAGNVVEGGACDAQAEGRAAGDRARQCGQGALCFNDPDDPLDPAQDWDQTGTCARICDPRNPVCGGDTRCFDLGREDDPATPQGEELIIGLCLEADCDIIADDCGAGEHCRTVTFTDAGGQCGASGAVAANAPCIRASDCAGHAICANAGDGATCLAICDPAAEENACGAAEDCFIQPGWAYGVCL